MIPEPATSTEALDPTTASQVTSETTTAPQTLIQADPPLEPASTAQNEIYTSVDFEDVVGGEIAPEALDKYLTESHQLGLTKDQITKQLIKGRELRDTIIEAQRTEYAKIIDNWHAELTADKEIGGDKLEQSFAIARLPLKNATPEFKETLERTGLQNHPEFVKLLYKLGLTMQPDTSVSGTPGRTELSFADRFYGK